jgi:ubiquinone/menaquinone biosynthesis C-methylase UbiE
VITERSFEAAQRFLLAAKKWWTSSLYQQLRHEYEARLGAGAAGGDVAKVAEGLEELTQYRYFAWLERHLQRMKYSGTYGLARYYDQERSSVVRSLEEGAGQDLLELNPALPLPKYYTQIDIHQHPGGVWSDEVAGAIYEHGARSTTPLLGSAHHDLHTRFTLVVADGPPPSRILDMGCGFGKSTQPFYQRFGAAQVEGVDLSAPCLRLAANTAHAAGAKNVHFRQRDAADSGYAASSFDLVTSTMLLHETPPAPLESLLAEASRVLEPGGRMVHLDFYWLPDAFTRFMFYGHGRRNNEPYMQPLAQLDLRKLLRRAGFEDIRIEPFHEAQDLGPERKDLWRLPWTVISARKLRVRPKASSLKATRPRTTHGGKTRGTGRASRP